jgi:dolichyl-phosphate beta-glucosyltransferase
MIMSKVWIVVPCYNEAKRLPSDAFLSFLSNAPEVSLCFVNDGSTDGTIDVINAIRYKAPEGAVDVIEQPRNLGKAEAVRRGMLHCADKKGVKYIGYWDADLATGLDEVLIMTAQLDRNIALLMVTGCRVKRLGASIDRHGLRHLLGRAFATFASLVIGLPVYDTQCGAKLFKHEIAGTIFQTPFLAKWIFDVEVFVRVRDLVGPSESLERILEMPLFKWTDIKGSKISLYHWFRAPMDLLKIYLSYR